MDFLKSLKIDDKDKHPSQTAPAAVPQPTVAPSGTGLLDKISGAFSGEHHQEAQKPAQVPVVEPPKEQPHEHGGLLGKLSDALGGDRHDKVPPPVPVAVAPQPAPTHHGVFDEITGALSGHHPHAEQAIPPPPPVKQEEKHESVLDKLGKAFGHDHNPPPPPPPVVQPPEHHSFTDKVFGHDHHTQIQAATAVPPKAEGLLDKLTHHESAPPPQPQHEGLLDKLGIHSKHPEPPKDQNLLDKISSKIHHDEPPKEQSLGDKIKNALGGGSAGEEKEDHIDKAIDFVQEHIMHQGSQDNESVVEQFKDKQIKEAIRDQYKHVTGHELGHDKDKKH